MCICLAAVIISGCSDKGKSQKDSNPSGQDFVLTEEQKNYLSDKKGIGTAALELMNKESINWNLLGTGFELYNKTSGVETKAEEYRKLQAPISGYDDTYLTIFFKVSDNKVFMKVPYIEYSGFV